MYSGTLKLCKLYICLMFWSYSSHTNNTYLQTSGLYFDSKLISEMVNEINRTLKKIVENEIERTQNAGTSEAGSDFLPTEETIKVIL